MPVARFSPSAAVVSPFSALLAAASYPLMCSARIRDGPQERLLRKRLTAHSISLSSYLTLSEIGRAS